MTDRERDAQPRGVLPSRHRYDLRQSAQIDPEDVLDRLDRLDVYTWTCVSAGDPGTQHLGPAAEDFYETFEFGETADRIAAGDTDGVALAAIQGLAARLDERTAQLQRHERRLERQRKRIEEQRQDIETLRERLESLQTEVSKLQSEDGSD